MSRTITVKGVGKVSAKPDYAVVSLKLEAKNRDYESAMKTAAKQITSLNESLAAVGFEKEAVKTTDFRVQTDYEDYKDPRGNYQRIFRGFVIRHQLKLAFDFDSKRLSQALSVLSQCLAHPELSVDFTVKDTAAVNEALLTDAAKAAKKKARILCKASGVKLGQLLSIDYNWGELDIYSDTKYDFNCESPICLSDGPVIDPDDIKVSDSVTLVWEIA